MSTHLYAAQVTRGPTPRRQHTGPARFCMSELSGRFVELSGQGPSSVLTYAVHLVLDVQAQGEPVAWVTGCESTFYAPDLAHSGVDLEALSVVRVPAAHVARGALAVSAERLLRSGAFGLVVLDLGRAAQVTQAMQSRLLGLAQRHQAVFLCLTEKAEGTPSLGSLVSLRVQASRKWLGGDRFECSLHALKDKERGPEWSQSEVCRGPLGLR